MRRLIVLCVSLAGFPVFADEAAVKFCKEVPFHAAECLKAIEGKTVTAEMMDNCRTVQTGKRPPEGRAECLRYFLGSASFYDPDAVEQCLRGNAGQFRAARSCLNAIRDRAVDLDEMKSCVKNPSRSPLGESFEDCVERVTDGADLRKDVLCSSQKKSSASAPSSGQP